MHPMAEKRVYATLVLDEDGNMWILVVLRGARSPMKKRYMYADHENKGNGEKVYTFHQPIDTLE